MAANNLWANLQNPTGNQTGNQFLGGLVGAGIGALASPKRKYKTTSKAQLDAATLPAMRQANAMRMAQMNATQSAQGGLGSTSAFENVLLRSQLAQNLGQQSALNQMAANNSQNAAYANDYQNKNNRLAAMLSLMKGGANLYGGNQQDVNPNVQPNKYGNNQFTSQSPIPAWLNWRNSNA